MGSVNGGDKTEITRSPTIEKSDTAFLYVPSQNVLYVVRRGALLKIDLDTDEQTEIDDNVSTLNVGPNGYVVYGKGNGEISLVDIESDKTTKIAKLPDQVDSFSSPISVTSISSMPSAVYYTVGKTLKKYIPGSSDDPVEIDTGKSNYVVDTVNNKLYSVFYDSSITSRNLDGTGRMSFIVTGMRKISDVKLDRINGILYFTDLLTNEIHSYVLSTKRKTMIYSNLRQPTELTITPSDG